MKIPNKRELQKIAIDHSLNINMKNLIKIYNKCTDKSYSFLVNDTTLSSDDPLLFRKNLYNIKFKKMTIDENIRDEKLQYDINREAAKISALSSNKIHKYEYLTGEDIIPSSNQQIVEQARFTYSSLGKAFNKQIKTIGDQGKKQGDALNTLRSDNNKKLEIKNEGTIPKSAFASDEAKEEINKILKTEKNVDREKLIYDAGKYTYDFRIFDAIRSFGEDIYNGKIMLKEADKDQSDLADEINGFIKTTKPRNSE